MAEAHYQVHFQTSPLGRITFIVYLCASLAGALFIALPLAILGLQAGGGAGWGTALGALMAGLAFSGLSMMAGLRAFGPGERVTLTEQGFKYDGLFRVSRIRWSEIESFKLSKGDFISRMQVQTKESARGGARKLVLDVGGLSPNAEDLMRAFAEASGIALPPPKVKPGRTKKVKPEAADGAEEAA
ncbi:MAG TPA: hypothetical protein VGN52_07545 [Burkholderiales bacterium]|jgi:hypothetical protein